MIFSRFSRLIRKSERLGVDSPIVMPVEEIRLAYLLSELPNKPKVVQRLMENYFDHSNPHVRRIAINACRRSECFEVAGLTDALIRKLQDEWDWVRYDAAWAIGDAGYDSPIVREALQEAAGDTKLPEDEILRAESPSDADLAARVRAREVLDDLERSSH
jgi:HEAT repeat protein